MILGVRPESSNVSTKTHVKAVSQFLPSWLVPVARITALMVSPSSSACFNDLMTIMQHPSPRLYPLARSSNLRSVRKSCIQVGQNFAHVKHLPSGLRNCKDESEVIMSGINMSCDAPIKLVRQSPLRMELQPRCRSISTLDQYKYRVREAPLRSKKCEMRLESMAFPPPMAW